MQTRPIHKLLIANRGEIAIRIMRTAEKMGIATVAVFSDADRDALFVRRAAQAHRLGPAPSRESYLRIDKILEAARATGADAIHPGFGFLAENDQLAQAVLDAGLVFVGPSPQAIRAMGLKREAKITAARVGVPVVPGYSGEEQSSEALARHARELGYPLLIKASAGGGGKGMRVVREDGALLEAIESARREAESSFGNGTLIIEKYIESPRHIEVQILGDEHGNLVHLFERECSIQRRHQKIIEESPSVAVDDALRERIGADAVKLCKEIGYSNAGTVELVMGPGGQYYFLEVNTRLQVEHPVTEGIVEGLDLVEEQIRVARGEKLRFTQSELAARRRGAAIECRLCAEDPANGFLPQSGRIVDFHLSRELVEAGWLRLESAVESGSEVPVHYDSMIAKLIVSGGDRAEAIARMRFALAHLSVQGIATNRAFLLRVLEHPDYAVGKIDTHFIETRMGGALTERPTTMQAQLAALAATFEAHHERRRTLRVLPHLSVTGWRNNRVADQEVEHTIAALESKVAVRYRDLGEGRFSVRVDGETPLEGEVRVRALGPRELALELPSGLRMRARVIRDGARVWAHFDGVSVALEEVPRFRDRDAEAAADGCVAPMPGKVLKVLVSEGERVEAGQTIVVMEAMKMEHAVRAPHAGLVKELRARAGEQVDGGALLAVVAAD